MNAGVRKMITDVFGLFRLKPEERVQAAVALTVIVVLNALFIFRLHELFLQPGFGPYWKVFERELHLSGYDPYTYLTVTDWDVVYEAHRHPLLAFFIWPLWLLNQGLTWVLGVNCVQYVVALVVITSSLYSYVFLYRIHREIVGLRRDDATLLTMFAFSMAYLLLSVIVPDHFTVSMFLLLMTFYISGICIRKGREFRWWQSAVLFFITAGVTLSNGIKVFLSGFFVNRRDFFRPKYLLLAVLLPSALLWGTAVWQHYTFVEPRQQAREKVERLKSERVKERVAKMSPEERARYEAKKARREAVLRRQAEKTGKPMEDHGYLKWTDISTSRWQTVYENLLGETIQFHRRHFLEDTLVGRPLFVPYLSVFSYVIEALVVLLALMGVWYGRRSRFLWLCLSCLAIDMGIHLVLGFGINEVFIMAPHFLFILPIATAYLLRETRGHAVRLAVTALTAYLFTYNGVLLTYFLLTPIKSIL
ncbi:MAG: GtrA family protein [Prevotella sp.]|nr:GtrA family protein [Prevotella sp.]